VYPVYLFLSVQDGIRVVANANAQSNVPVNITGDTKPKLHNCPINVLVRPDQNQHLDSKVDRTNVNQSSDGTDL
jgi:hypothetical protein